MIKSTPEQKALWREHKGIGSRKIKFHNSYARFPWGSPGRKPKKRGTLAVRAMRSLAGKKLSLPDVTLKGEYRELYRPYRKSNKGAAPPWTSRLIPYPKGH